MFKNFVNGHWEGADHVAPSTNPSDLKDIIGEYALADETYKDLLEKLKDEKFENLTPLLRQNIIDFYQLRDEQFSSKDPDKWKEINEALNELKAAKITIHDVNSQ